MAAGKAVVATAVGGLPDLIGDGVHGLLVPPGDPDGLAEALASLLLDPERRASMGEAGRERQRRDFDFAGMVRKLEERYEELVAGKISP
jgi:starch synthase